VNQLLSVEDLYLDLSLIHQLHLTAIWRIEKRLNLVAMIDVLRSQAGVSLLHDSLTKPCLCDTSEVIVQGCGPIGGKSIREVPPSLSVITRHAFARPLFDGTRTDRVSIQGDSG